MLSYIFGTEAAAKMVNTLRFLSLVHSIIIIVLHLSGEDGAISITYFTKPVRLLAGHACHRDCPLLLDDPSIGSSSQLPVTSRHNNISVSTGPSSHKPRNGLEDTHLIILTHCPPSGHPIQWLLISITSSRVLQLREF